MAVVADRVIVELEAKLDKYNANLKRAERQFSQTTDRQAREIRALETQISRSSGAIGSQLRTLAGTFAAAFSARQVQELADGYTRFQNQLSVAGLEGERMADVQRELFASAQQYGVALESLGTLYSRGAQVSGELGASQADLLKFSNGVAAALKIQGTSAVEAQGALLQLSQALGSGTVRAEEFNSINEGALPILKAVAQNMDAAGGSVAKLKTLVNEGKVSSEDFFRSFLAGSAELEAQASKATLTIGNSFTVLNNALGVYVGEADESLSATERVSAAIIALSENLDLVVSAIGVLSAVLLGRYVAANAAAAASTIGTSTAITALQLRAMGAVTTMQALGATSAVAGRAMLAAFGGPVGLAVTALAGGVYYLATRTDEGAQASKEYAEQLDYARSSSEKTREATDALATATGRAREAALANAEALREETKQYLANAKAAVQAAIAKRQQVITENNERIRASTRNTTGAGGGYDSTAAEIRASERRVQQAQANVWAAVEAVGEYNKQLNALDKQIAAAPAVNRGTGGGGAAGKKKTGRGGSADREAERAARAEAQFLSEVDQLYADELALRAELTGRLEDRLAADLARIDADAASFARSVALDDQLTDAQREKLLAERQNVDALKRQAAQNEAAVAELERSKRLADARNELDRQILQAQLEGTRGRQARAEIERRILALAQSQERAELEHTVATLELLDVESEELRIAKARLARLGELEKLERQNLERDNQSPLERYADSLDKSNDELADEAEQLIVDEIEAVRRSMRDALSDAIGTDDPLITGLLDLLIEQVVLKPLADALAGAANGTGGGFIQVIGGVLGAFTGRRASGGHVRGGGSYRVTDGEGFQPAGSGKIIPLGRMRGSGGAGTIINQTVKVDASGGVNPEGYAEHIVERVREETVAIVGAGMKQVSDKVPARMAQFQRDGT